MDGCISQERISNEEITLGRIAEIAEVNDRAWHGDGEFRSVVDRHAGYAV